jgi:hypothetical protein
MFELYSNIYITYIFTLNIYLSYTVIHLKYFDYYFYCSYFFYFFQFCNIKVKLVINPFKCGLDFVTFLKGAIFI